MFLRIVLLFVSVVAFVIYSDYRYKLCIRSLPESLINETSKGLYVMDDIDPSDTNFVDFEFLIPILKDKQLICLGEENHFQGTAHQAKAKLIKFLHQKLDFKVVLYEAGLYDMWNMNENNPPNKINPEEGLYLFWWKTTESNDLWTYYKDNSFSISGFDIQMTGNNPDRINKLNHYLLQRGIDTSLFQCFRNIAKEDKFSIVFNFPSYFPSDAQCLYEDLLKLDSILYNQRDGLENEIYYRYIHGLRWNLYYSINYKLGSRERFEIRDSLMADNITFLMDTLFKDQKCIVWSANIHVMYGQDFISMGEYLKSKLKDKMYSISFTSYQTSPNIERTSANSLEYTLHNLNKEYIYIDLNQGVFQDEFVLSVDHKAPKRKNWSKMIDGLFFIDKSKQINYIK